jgi:hypothetical protein
MLTSSIWSASAELAKHPGDRQDDREHHAECKAKMDNVGDVALNGGPQTKSPAALGVTGMDEVGAPRLPLNRTCRTHESKHGAFSRTGKEGGVHDTDWLGLA